jgi:hypothetical protein
MFYTHGRILLVVYLLVQDESRNHPAGNCKTKLAEIIFCSTLIEMKIEIKLKGSGPIGFNDWSWNICGERSAAMRCTLQGVGGSQGSHIIPNGDDMTPWC